MDFQRLMEDWILPLLFLGAVTCGILAISGVIKF